MKQILLSARTITLLVGVFLAIASTAQRTCSSMEYLQQQIAADPDRAAQLEAIDSFTEAWIEEHGAEDRAVVTIPVVFHVVYANTTQNISDAKIQAQIAQLNADFARLNSDAGQTPSIFTGVAANTEVQFCLAQRDASGNATTGIVRRNTTTTSFSDNDGVKFTSSGGSNAWPSASYLNIWSCNLGGGLLGYAQFPGGGASTDGVVILYSSVGSLTNPGTATPYHLGRTLTHEVGHWLNLRHIWGDANCGSDLVSDTPIHNTSNFGCPTYPHYSTCSGTPVEMTSNYMDYTDDACMNIFTGGQKTRMQALFGAGGSRLSLASSLGCVPPSGGTCAVPSGLASNSVTSSSATVTWGAASGAVSYNVQYTPTGGSTTTVNTTSTSYAISGLSASTTYSYQVQTVCSASSSAYSTAGSFTTSAAGSTCGTPTGLAASSITSTTATVSWTAVSGAVSYNLQYKLASSGTWTTYNTTSTSVNFTSLTASTGYNAQVQTVCSSASSNYTTAITFTTSAAGCSDTWESNNSSSTAKTISVNTDITALIGSTTDVDWFKFSNTSSQRRIRVNLTDLAGDYDMKLYRGTSTLIATAQQGGTTSEQIIHNTSTVATYYVKVYGYNGAFSTTQCYNLRANISATNWREGQFDESEAEVMEASGLMSLYPNPARDKVMIDYLASEEGLIQVQVIDAMGRNVLTRQQSVVEGPATYGLPLPALAKGVYVLTITDGDKRYQQRLMIEQ